MRIEEDIEEEDEAEESSVSTARLVAAACCIIACGFIVYNAIAGQPGVRREVPPEDRAGTWAETASREDLEPEIPSSVPKIRVRVEVPEDDPAPPPAASDEPVREVQSALIALGRYRGTADGRTSPALSDAIMAAERQFGMEATGRATPELAGRLRLEQEIALALGQAPQPVAQVTSEPAVEGQALGHVSMIQRGLAKLGYDPGPADGNLGPKTRDAIRLFERDRKRAETGEATPDLAREIEELVGG